MGDYVYNIESLNEKVSSFKSDDWTYWQEMLYQVNYFINYVRNQKFSFQAISVLLGDYLNAITLYMARSFRLTNKSKDFLSKIQERGKEKKKHIQNSIKGGGDSNESKRYFKWLFENLRDDIQIKGMLVEVAGSPQAQGTKQQITNYDLFDVIHYNVLNISISCLLNAISNLKIKDKNNNENDIIKLSQMDASELKPNTTILNIDDNNINDIYDQMIKLATDDLFKVESISEIFNKDQSNKDKYYFHLTPQNNDGIQQKHGDLINFEKRLHSLKNIQNLKDEHKEVMMYTCHKLMEIITNDLETTYNNNNNNTYDLDKLPESKKLLGNIRKELGNKNPNFKIPFVEFVNTIISNKLRAKTSLSNFINDVSKEYERISNIQMDYIQDKVIDDSKTALKLEDVLKPDQYDPKTASYYLISRHIMTCMMVGVLYVNDGKDLDGKSGITEKRLNEIKNDIIKKDDKNEIYLENLDEIKKMIIGFFEHDDSKDINDLYKNANSFFEYNFDVFKSLANYTYGNISKSISEDATKQIIKRIRHDIKTILDKLKDHKDKISDVIIKVMNAENYTLVDGKTDLLDSGIDIPGRLDELIKLIEEKENEKQQQSGDADGNKDGDADEDGDSAEGGSELYDLETYKKSYNHDDGNNEHNEIEKRIAQCLDDIKESPFLDENDETYLDPAGGENMRKANFAQASAQEIYNKHINGDDSLIKKVLIDINTDDIKDEYKDLYTLLKKLEKTLSGAFEKIAELNMAIEKINRYIEKLHNAMDIDYSLYVKDIDNVSKYVTDPKEQMNSAYKKMRKYNIKRTDIENLYNRTASYEYTDEDSGKLEDVDNKKKKLKNVFNNMYDFRFDAKDILKKFQLADIKLIDEYLNSLSTKKLFSKFGPNLDKEYESYTSHIESDRRYLKKIIEYIVSEFKNTIEKIELLNQPKKRDIPRNESIDYNYYDDMLYEKERKRTGEYLPRLLRTGKSLRSDTAKRALEVLLRFKDVVYNTMIIVSDKITEMKTDLEPITRSINNMISFCIDNLSPREKENYKYLVDSENTLKYKTPQQQEILSIENILNNPNNGGTHLIDPYKKLYEYVTNHKTPLKSNSELERLRKANKDYYIVAVEKTSKKPETSIAGNCTFLIRGHKEHFSTTDNKYSLSCGQLYSAAKKATGRSNIVYYIDGSGVFNYFMCYVRKYKKQAIDSKIDDVRLQNSRDDTMSDSKLISKLGTLMNFTFKNSEINGCKLVRQDSAASLKGFHNFSNENRDLYILEENHNKDNDYYQTASKIFRLLSKEYVVDFKQSLKGDYEDFRNLTKGDPNALTEYYKKNIQNLKIDPKGLGIQEW